MTPKIGRTIVLKDKPIVVVGYVKNERDERNIHWQGAAPSEGVCTPYMWALKEKQAAKEKKKGDRQAGSGTPS